MIICFDKHANAVCLSCVIYNNRIYTILKGCQIEHNLFGRTSVCAPLADPFLPNERKWWLPAGSSHIHYCYYVFTSLIFPSRR